MEQAKRKGRQTSQAADLNSFRFSTRNIPPRRRRAVWNDTSISRPLSRRILSPAAMSKRGDPIEQFGERLRRGYVRPMAGVDLEVAPGRIRLRPLRKRAEYVVRADLGAVDV